MSDTSVKRYWIYTHNEEGDIVNDADVVDSLDEAVGVSANLLSASNWNRRHAVHIVDQWNDHKTVWIAGSCAVDGEA
jgi:hypothetical protein